MKCQKKNSVTRVPTTDYWFKSNYANMQIKSERSAINRRTVCRQATDAVGHFDPILTRTLVFH